MNTAVEPRPRQKPTEPQEENRTSGGEPEATDEVRKPTPLDIVHEQINLDDLGLCRRD